MIFPACTAWAATAKLNPKAVDCLTCKIGFRMVSVSATGWGYTSSYYFSVVVV
jgi:hypothetical protein